MIPIKTAKTARILNNGVNVDTSRLYVENIQNILKSTENIAAIIMGIQSDGNEALLNSAIGTVNNSVTAVNKKLNNHGLAIECLLVNFAVITIKPEVIAPIHAKK
jgi:hypothetical protein